MNTLIIFALISFAYGESLENGKNIKRTVKELTVFEKLYILNHHPEIPLADIAKSEGIGLFSAFDLYTIEIPTLAAFAFPLGYEIPIPEHVFEYGFYFCYLGVCTGFNEVNYYVRPIVYGANNTRMSTKIVDGNKFEMLFQIPDMTSVSDGYTQDYVDLVTGDKILKRGQTRIIRNLTLQYSGRIEFVPGVGIQMKETEYFMGVEDFRMTYENATHTFPDGTTEEWGMTEIQWEDTLNDWWGDIIEESRIIDHYFNCFLSGGRNGDECSELIGNGFVQQNFAQMMHVIVLGLKNDMGA